MQSVSEPMQNRNQRTTTSGLRNLFEAMVSSQMAQAAGPPARRDAPSASAARPRPSAERTQPEGGVYIISVAARILSMHPQTLRKYERVGLVRPSRTIGMLRLYSELDITKLRVIKRLVDELRLNLAGVEIAMAVFDTLSAARYAMDDGRSASTETFERMFDQIMALFEGSRIPRSTLAPPRNDNA
jgi:MerR family transcriptional regulator/heat shock protein HspR